MLRLFEREIAAANRRLVVLAPAHAKVPRSLQNVSVDPKEHQQLVGDLQRLRGGIYLKDGALRQDQLTADGRHVTPEDGNSWHLLALDEDERITGCIWYRDHQGTPTLDQLRVRNCALARHDEWKHKLRTAVHSEVAQAKRERIGYAEVGGWAVACEAQCVSAALLLILGTYSLSQAIGGALVIATATVRHSSAKILRRLGGSLLETPDFVVPEYYDPSYDCMMELLRFDTRRPAEKYAAAVRALKGKLAEVRVVVSNAAQLEPSVYGETAFGAPSMVAAA